MLLSYQDTFYKVVFNIIITWHRKECKRCGGKKSEFCVFWTHFIFFNFLDFIFFIFLIFIFWSAFKVSFLISKFTIIYLYFLKWWKRRINYSQPFFLKRTSHTPPHPTLESMTQRTMVQNLKFSKHWHRLKDLRERENWTLRICPAIVQTINEKDTLLCLQQSLLNRGCQTCDFFFTLLIFPLYKKLYRSYSINKRKFSKTSRDIAANNAIKTLIPRLLMSEFSVSEKRKKWKHCDLNFLDKHKTQFKDLLNIFGKIHFTLIVTHTKLILSRNVTFFCCQLFCLQSCITAVCRISIYKSISDIELSFLSFSFLFLFNH